MDGKSPNNELCYTLACIIQAHYEDSKCVAELPSGSLVSGGRDGFMKYWTPKDDSYEPGLQIQQRNALAINSLALKKQNDDDVLIFIGRKDGSIAIFTPNTVEPIKVLKGHKMNVCALYFDQPTGLLMSGSWDHNAIVWPISDLLRDDGAEVGIGMLTGHTCSVWAVASLPAKPVMFLTGSADKTIKLWSDSYDEIGAFKGHEDVVRSIVVLSEQHFLSSSNDATIRLWDTRNGTNLRTFQVHDQFIYTMSRLQFDENLDLLIAGGEGGCVEFFALNGVQLKHVQSLKVPVHSVWGIAPMQNKDIALATSSGLVLVFTADQARAAPPDVQEFFYSSQLDAIEAKDREVQKAKDGSFDLNMFGAENGVNRELDAGQQQFAAQYSDPFTGAGRYVPGGAPTQDDKVLRTDLEPSLNDYCKFGLEGVSTKVLIRLRDINTAQPADIKMTDEEVGSLEPILQGADFEMNEWQVDALEKGLKWSAEAIVPMLDIFRLALLNPALNEIFCSLQPVFGNPPKGAATISRMLTLLSAEPPDPVRILICRSLTNAAAHEFGRAMLLSGMADGWRIVAAQLTSPGKTALQISATSALQNFARIVLTKQKPHAAIVELGPTEDAFQFAVSIANAVQDFSGYSPIALTRLLQGILLLVKSDSALIPLCGRQMKAPLTKMRDQVGDEGVQHMCRHLLAQIEESLA